MQIKRLELRGFKSFADKTELNLADGVTAVVGPNGSGKSNLADAIKWVLGEQSAKVLRGARMDELIFSGTKTRRGLGLAEVSLIFNNESGRFPLAYNEIAVTRRIFKSGESEYYLNRNRCRLKDVQDLFMDTGIGKDAYSFIGQGRIDELLSLRPQDRRAIFEEAAGIAKYKDRKRETENKLQDSRAALVRIHDLLFELRKEHEVLQLEAQRAEEYGRLQDNLKAIELDLLLYEINMAQNQETRNASQRDKLIDEGQRRQTYLINREALEESLILKIAELQTAVDGRNGELSLALRQLDQLINEKELLRRQQTDKVSQAEMLASRVSEFLNSRRTLETMEGESLDLLAQAEASQAEARFKLEHLRQRLNNLGKTQSSAEVEEAEAVLQNLQAAQREADAALSLWQGREIRGEAELKAEQIQERDLVKREQELKIRLEGVTADRIAIEKTVADGEKELLALEQERQMALRQLDDDLEEDRRLLQETKVLENRHHLLEEIVSGHEGYYQGVRQLLLASRKSELLKGILGVVGEQLQMDAKYEVALEAALGSSLQFVLAQTEADAERGIQWLKQNRRGRATFLPLDVVKPRQRRENALRASRLPGALGFASDLVAFAPRYHNVMHYLLGHILVVENISQGLAIARRVGHSVYMVTLEGDILMPGGSLSGGSRQQEGARFLGRGRELRGLKTKLATLVRQQEALGKAIARRRQNLAQSDISFADKKEALIEKQERLESLVTHSALLQQSVDELGAALVACRRRMEAPKAQLSPVQKARAEAQAEISRIEEALLGQEEVLAGLRKASAEHWQERQELEAAIHAQELKLASLNEQISGRRRELAVTQERLQTVGGNHGRTLQERAELVDKLTIIKSELEGLQERLVEKKEVAAQRESQLRGLKAKLAEVNNELAACRTEVRKAREAIDENKEQLYAVELRHSRIRAQHEAMTGRLQRDFGISERENLHSTLQSRRQGEEKLEEAQQLLLQFGSVRSGAVEEFERLNERITFLNSQEADILSSCTALEKIIDDLDQIMSKRFADSFKRIKQSFLRIFRELFGGGEADLLLSDPQQPLQTGIEIMAQPPGKNLQNINLLSGGEKALTAIALLCATLEVKPTPFCLLDEIDASLDETNTRRFMQVISRLKQDTQFILITHSKQTMLAVDILYGVTMPEQGVSQLISVDLTDIET